MELRLYDNDIIQIISKYFKVEEENVDVFEENSCSWFRVEISNVEQIKIKRS